MIANAVKHYEEQLVHGKYKICNSNLFYMLKKKKKKKKKRKRVSVSQNMREMWINISESAIQHNAYIFTLANNFLRWICDFLHAFKFYDELRNELS